MRRLLAVSLTSSLLAFGGVAGVAAPAALAAGTVTSSAASSVPTPTLNLDNAASNAAAANTVTSTPVTTTTSSSGGLSGFDAVLIAIIAVLVLGGIAFYVWYDSRGFAKTFGHHASDDREFAGVHTGSKKPQKSRKPSAAERKRRKRGRAR